MSDVRLNWAQKAVHKNLGEIISGNVARSFVDMPTGTGKTGAFLSLLDIFHAADVLPSTLVLGPTKLIANNNFKEIEKFAPRIFGADDGARLTLSDLGDHSARTKPVKIMTYNSGIEALREGLIKPGLVILDEGHHALSGAREEILAGLNHDNIQIAFTASPNYSKEKSLEKSGYKEAYQLNLDDAVKGNLLADIRNVLVTMKDFDGVFDNIQMLGQDYDPDALERIVNDNRLLDAAIKFYDEAINGKTGMPYFGTSALVSCNSIAHAIAYEKRFNDAHPQNSFENGVIGCAAIWGRMPDAKKDELLEKHKSGEILQLASADYLIEGYDNPRIGLALNLRPTRSGVVAEQRGGRPVRFDHNNPEKEAAIVDFVFPSKRNQQLLYGDVIGGFLFEKSAPFVNKRSGKLSSSMNVIEGLDISYDQKEVFNFLRKREIDATIGRNNQLDVYNPIISRALAARNFLSQDSIHKAVDQFLYQNQLEHDPRYHFQASKQSVLDVLSGKKSPFKVGGSKNLRAYINGYTLTASVISGILQMPLKKLFGPIPEDAIADINTEFGGPDPDYIYHDGHDYDIDGIEERGELVETPETLQEALERYYEESLADPDDDVDALIDRKKLTERTKKVLSRLSPKEEFVIRARFGFNAPNNDGMTLEEVGEIYGVTKERIRQIGNKVDQQLIHPQYASYLRRGKNNIDDNYLSGAEIFKIMHDCIDGVKTINSLRKNKMNTKATRMVPAEKVFPDSVGLQDEFKSNSGAINIFNALMVNNLQMRARKCAQILGYKKSHVWAEPAAPKINSKLEM